MRPFLKRQIFDYDTLKQRLREMAFLDKRTEDYFNR